MICILWVFCVHICVRAFIDGDQAMLAKDDAESSYKRNDFDKEVYK